MTTTSTRQRGVRAVTYKCGHRGRENMASVDTAKRDSRVAWIKENKLCRLCWEKSVGFVSREQRQQELGEEEQAKGWVALAGSSKQVPWAMQIRHDKLAEIYELLVVETASHSEEEYIEQIEAPAGQIAESKFWIDNRELSPDLLADEINMYEVAEDSEGCENPF